MTQEHPITPPPKFVEQWDSECESDVDAAMYLATQAARWGSDQELEACISAVLSHPGFEQPELFVELLRAARRPQPPSLKEQALKELKNWTDEKHGLGGEVHLCEGLSVAIVRRALESLPD